MSKALKKLSKLWSQLDPHQRRIAEKALKLKTIGIFAEQRTGKTWIAIAVIERLLHSGFEGLIVCPLTNKETTWIKHLNELIPTVSICLTWDHFQHDRKSGPAILIIHYAMLDKLTRRLARRRWDIIIGDEVQAIKSRSSINSRRFRQLRYSSEYKLGMTGTPMDKSAIDLWAIFRWIKPELLGDVWADFDEEYLTPTGFMGYKRKLRPSKERRLFKKLGPHIYRFTAEAAGIRKARITRVPVTLGPQLRKYYDQMEQDLVLEAGGLEVAADLAITQIIKLHQICNGFIIDEDREVHWLKGVNRKRNRILKLVDREPTPTIIFCRFKQEIIALEKELRGKYRVKILWGKIKDRKIKKHRTWLIEEFQRGELDVLLCQMKTGGVGLDLFSAETFIICSTNYSWIDFDQMMARTNYRGRKYRSHGYLVYSRATVDEDIILSVRNKEKITKRVWRGIKRRSAN